MPNGLPALKQASAAFSMASLVHAFASAVSGTSAAGYIFTRSSPANSFIKLMRPAGPLFCVPQLDGTATHLPFSLPR